MAVQNAYFPLFEIEDGDKVTLNLKLKDKKPVSDYLRIQGRFRHLTEAHVASIQAEVDARWERLLKSCAA
jgi:pyruvate/2-oxoacid:ferredoxin oxidoreductase beta subunit